jgi:hypothetical protein
MSTFSTPTWSAQHNGILGDASAMANAADINQLLGTHAQTLVYQGTEIVTPNGTGVSSWALELSTQDVDQPFTMSGTVVGRVQVPLLSVGDGADLLVSLCANNAGAPGTLINQVRIPAEWIYRLAAVAAAAGPSTDTPLTETTGNPLAVSQFNGLVIGPYTTTPYSPPASGPSNIISPMPVASGNYLILLGGSNQDTSAYVATVFTAYADGTELQPLIPQASLPQTNGGSGGSGAAVTTDTIVLTGGFINSTDVAPTADVFVASWDSSSGTIGAWSVQTVLPQALSSHNMAAYGETVYIIGGMNSAGSSVNTVYYTTIQNGQITGWNTGTPLPVALNTCSAIAMNGFLFVVGGENNGTPLSTSYYACINPDGSLGNWIASTAALGSFNGTNSNQAASTPQGFLITGDSAYGLGAAASGPSPVWTLQNDISFTSGANWILVPDSGADYRLFTNDPISGRYRTGAIITTPYISVPLPTTGLTNGATYHVLMQQQGGDENNYLRTHTDTAVFSGNPTVLTSPSNAYSWTAQTPSGTAVPMQVFNNSIPPAPGMPALHLWDDNGARVTTFVHNTTPDLALIGLCEATVTSTAANENTGFETTLTPWTVTGGTVTRSSVQAYEGAFSARVVPSGAATNVYIESELLPCLPGQSITIAGWVWTTSAVTTNFSMSVNWYTTGNVYISTSSSSVSIPAATWTFVTNTFTATTAGGGGFKYTLNPTLGGTPAASNVFYVDDVIGFPTHVGPQLASVAQIGYLDATYPGIATSKPTGLTVLA